MTPRQARVGPGGAPCVRGAGVGAGAGRSGLSALALLREAHGRLGEAGQFHDPGDRYAAAHVAALRAAAAVLAVRGSPLTTPPPRRRRPANAWVLLTAAAPEFAGWAEFFAANAGKRAAAEAGVRDAATAREADELIGLVRTFLAAVETTLGLASAAVPVPPKHPHRPGVPGRARRSALGTGGGEQFVEGHRV